MHVGAWVSGSAFANAPGTYGSMFIGSTSVMPGARESFGMVLNTQYNCLTIYGGLGYDDGGSRGAVINRSFFSLKLHFRQLK